MKLMLWTILAIAIVGGTSDSGSKREPSSKVIIRISPTGRVHTRQSIDGAQRPESIPDSLAYHYLLRAVAAESEPGGDKRRREGYFRHIGFDSSNEDSARALSSVALEYEARLAALGLVLSQMGISERSATFVAQREELVRRAMSQIAASLRPDRAATVDTFVMEHVRRKIKLMP
jgi:hypothetical protein